jgi:hypothetical protein
MLYFKEIPLHPTRFKLHVISCEDDEHQVSFVKDNYEKFADDQDFNDCYGDFVIILIQNDKKVIVCGFENLKDRSGFVHEIVHIKHRLNLLSGVELNCASQEWEACFTEFLFNEICKPNYEKFKKK